MVKSSISMLHMTFERILKEFRMSSLTKLKYAQLHLHRYLEYPSCMESTSHFVTSVTNSSIWKESHQHLEKPRRELIDHADSEKLKESSIQSSIFLCENAQQQCVSHRVEKSNIEEMDRTSLKNTMIIRYQKKQLKLIYLQQKTEPWIDDFLSYCSGLP